MNAMNGLMKAGPYEEWATHITQTAGIWIQLTFSQQHRLCVIEIYHQCFGEGQCSTLQFDFNGSESQTVCVVLSVYEQYPFFKLNDKT